MIPNILQEVLLMVVSVLESIKFVQVGDGLDSVFTELLVVAMEVTKLISILGAFFLGGTGGPLIAGEAIARGDGEDSLELCAWLKCPSGNDEEIRSISASLNCDLLDVLPVENRVFRGGMAGFASG